MREWQLLHERVKEEAQTALLEKDAVIHNLREMMGRMEGEIRERTQELSMVRSPPMKSLNQSYAGEVGRN